MGELASFSERSRQRAFERFELLRAHIQDGRPLAAIAREAKLSYRTLQYWLERYQTSGLAALARKPRADRGQRRKLSAALQEVIEGLALQKPPLSIRVLCNRAKLIAERLGEEPLSYDVVYDIVSHLPADLLTLAHRGAKAYSNSFGTIITLQDVLKAREQRRRGPVAKLRERTKAVDQLLELKRNDRADGDERPATERTQQKATGPRLKRYRNE